MGTFVALLRGVNVGGRSRLKMNDLVEVFHRVGFGDPRTYLQSGNVVFESATKFDSRAQRSIENELAKSLDIHATVIVRTSEQLIKVVSSNPFVQAGADPAQLYVTFLSVPPDHGLASDMRAPTDETDEFAIAGSEIYLRCTHGYGTTKLNNGFVERKLKVQATTRNWRTVNSLVELAAKG